MSITSAVPLDSQVRELLGRNWLLSELLRARLEVATPVRDRGIDLIAYADRVPGRPGIVARPIQMKAASKRAFGFDRKYELFPGLLLAYVWDLEDPHKTATFALTYAEALDVAQTMGWTTTASWAHGLYVNTNPGTKLTSLLAPYRMTPDAWWRKVVG